MIIGNSHSLPARRNSTTYIQVCIDNEYQSQAHTADGILIETCCIPSTVVPAMMSLSIPIQELHCDRIGVKAASWRCTRDRKQSHGNQHEFVRGRPYIQSARAPAGCNRLHAASSKQYDVIALGNLCVDVVVPFPEVAISTPPQIVLEVAREDILGDWQLHLNRLVDAIQLSQVNAVKKCADNHACSSSLDGEGCHAPIMQELMTLNGICSLC